MGIQQVKQERHKTTRIAGIVVIPASTWEAIIARESNGQVNEKPNASGASGLFKLCQVGDQQTLQWMIKSINTMPILTKDFQLGGY